jgi:hypothetical protein
MPAVPRIMAYVVGAATTDMPVLLSYFDTLTIININSDKVRRWPVITGWRSFWATPYKSMEIPISLSQFGK